MTVVALAILAGGILSREGGAAGRGEKWPGKPHLGGENLPRHPFDEEGRRVMEKPLLGQALKEPSRLPLDLFDHVPYSGLALTVEEVATVLTLTKGALLAGGISEEAAASLPLVSIKGHRRVVKNPFNPRAGAQVAGFEPIEVAMEGKALGLPPDEWARPGGRVIVEVDLSSQDAVLRKHPFERSKDLQAKPPTFSQALRDPRMLPRSLFQHNPQAVPWSLAETGLALTLVSRALLEEGMPGSEFDHMQVEALGSPLKGSDHHPRPWPGTVCLRGTRRRILDREAPSSVRGLVDAKVDLDLDAVELKGVWYVEPQLKQPPAITSKQAKENVAEMARTAVWAGEPRLELWDPEWEDAYPKEFFLKRKAALSLRWGMASTRVVAGQQRHPGPAGHEGEGDYLTDVYRMTQYWVDAMTGEVHTKVSSSFQDRPRTRRRGGDVELDIENERHGALKKGHW